METSRSGESPSRLPSSEVPWTLIRSNLPLSVGELAGGAARAASPQMAADTASARVIVSMDNLNSPELLRRQLIRYGQVVTGSPPVNTRQPADSIHIVNHIERCR